MTPQEINEAVARKLGWVQMSTPDNWKHPDFGEFLDIPNYSQDISAAWEMMEKKEIAVLPTDKGWYATSNDSRLDEGECLELWIPTACGTRNECGCGRCVIADTAPMAICLAFLKLENK